MGGLHPHFLQHPLPQRQIPQIRDIARQGVLVDVVEQERRQAAFGGEAVIVGGGDDHGCLLVWWRTGERGEEVFGSRTN